MSQSLRSALTGVSVALLIIFAFGYFAVDIAQSQEPTEQPTETATEGTEPTEDPTVLPTTPGGDDEVTTDRLGGNTRFETSVSISQEAFPQGSEDVFLARADIFPDALSAGSLTTGPILLVEQCGEIPEVIRDEIERLSPERVVALGGEAAVCEQVLQDAAEAAAGGDDPSESPSPSPSPTGTETPTEACTPGPPLIGDECPTDEPSPTDSPTETVSPTETGTPTS